MTRQIIPWLFQRPKLRFGFFAFLLVLIASVVVSLHPSHNPSQESNYTIASRVNFNQPSYYPLKQVIATDLYRPTGNWVGRLILPPLQQTQTTDWVDFEVYDAPTSASNLVGKVVRLEWSQEPEVQALVKPVTRDVNFTPVTEENERVGNLHPDRLNHHLQVGPLQSLAGARPNNDVIVSLEQVTVSPTQAGLPVLRIAQAPVQVTGRFYGLVKVLSPEAMESQNSTSTSCPGQPPCPSDFFRVRHYNPKSQRFDGPLEVIRIPQQPPDRDGVFRSTPRLLETSPAGLAGWYVYGAKNADGIFVAQAIAPRSLFRLKPQLILGKAAGQTYINSQNWQITSTQKGTVRTVLIDPTTTQPEQALSDWREGDKALVMHNFGGRGGQKSESFSLGTVTGHFAYGLAQVVRDPLTQELKLDIQYQQIYVQNPDGIISGAIAWSAYMGNLQNGWMGNRPVSDVLIKLDAVTQDYNFDGIILSPLEVLMQKLQIMAARYRIGDGTGGALVTPATSCVQDSNQAIYLTLKHIERQVKSTPVIQKWLQEHPNNPQTLRFQQLVALGKTLEENLAPLGIVRPDWTRNAATLSGTNTNGSLVGQNNPLTGFLSWRTLLPRRAHDEVARIFLSHGAKLWFIRTNQVGGWDPDIAPVAPTELLGQFPVLSTVVTRLLAALTTLPDPRGWLTVVGILLTYGAIALPLGFSSGFLRLNIWSTSWLSQLQLAWRALLSPALSEELVFRVLLIPHPTEGVSWGMWGLWASLSLFLFIIYHPLNAKTFFRVGYPTFFDPVFLTLTGILGILCTVAYAQTGSLWAITAIHWFVVVIWLLRLGGYQKLKST